MNSQSILQRLQLLVEMESPSGDVEHVAALGRVLRRELEGAGAAVVEHEAPGFGLHLEARVEGGQPELPPLLLLGHMDTVWPVGTLAERPFRVLADRAVGPGVYDMKGGLSVLLETLAGIRESGERPRRPLRVLITCDEEVGSHTSRRLIEALAAGAAGVLVLEPALPGGAAKTARKGVGDFVLRAFGLAAHAGGEPEKGISAITEIVHQVPTIQGMAAPELGTTVSVCLIGGGTASNVIPAEAWVEVDVRFSTAAEAQRVDGAIRSLAPALPGARLEVSGGINRPPMERTAATAALFAAARDIAAGVGLDLDEGSAGGASDGNFTAALGAPTLDGLGPDGGGAHAIDEHVLVADLPGRVALLRGLLLGL